MERIHDAPRSKVRESEGRDASPSAAIIDSQSVKTTQKGGSRIRRGQESERAKRRIIVDAQVLLLDAVVHPADIQDRDGAKQVVGKLAGRFPKLSLIWGDGGCAGKFADWVRENADCDLAVVRKPKGERGFAVIPRRWAVERTFARLGNFRRLSKDYEDLSKVWESWVRTAMIHLMLRRLTA